MRTLAVSATLTLFDGVLEGIEAIDTASESLPVNVDRTEIGWSVFGLAADQLITLWPRSLMQLI